MKLLIQSDDYGITEAVSEGIVKGIKKGVIRNTGLFVNMPSSAQAALNIKQLEAIAVGIDINLVAGKPVSDANLVATLINEAGRFYSSSQRKEHSVLNSEVDPFAYEETLIETENQVLKFVELMGRKPAYIHPHSFMSNNSIRAMKEVAKKYNIVCSLDILSHDKIAKVPCDWTQKPFPLQQQLDTDVTNNLIASLEKVKNEEYAAFICHAGYVDATLFEESSYTIIRTKDLEAMVSFDLLSYIKNNNIELITYSDLVDL